jgi:hypothetical protein
MSASTEQLLLWVGSALLITLVAVEIFRPFYFKEGFETLQANSNYFSTYAPKRGDIGPGDEEGGYVRDPRYFNDYANVQRLGVKHDFCRVLKSKNNPDILFFACALAGTEGLSSVDFRTITTRDGLRLSRDDYMRDMNNDGRDDYCRILKAPDGSYQASCNRATDKGFDERLVIDTNPPDEIKTLLTFYEGCVFWLRLRDDMLDYVNNLRVLTAGGIVIDEKPRPTITKGVHFNGIDQFIRIGDSPDLELGYSVPLRSLRAICVWVYFNEFTNNAHILDFGNGAGNDNIFLGIVGRGDASVSGADQEIRPNPCSEDQTTVPTGPSGAQLAPEMSPQELMKTTSANVDEYSCTGFEMFPRRLEPSRVVPLPPKQPTGKATLIYEVWDKKQRKMRLLVPNSIPKNKWTHIAITAVELDSFRPTIKVYINGEDMLTKPSGFLPQASTTSKNYLGKSNWLSDTSQYENKDELFNGYLFDVRGYKTPMSAKKIKDTYEWGQNLLGLK